MSVINENFDLCSVVTFMLIGRKARGKETTRKTET
jgi:hypothetical protein